MKKLLSLSALIFLLQITVINAQSATDKETADFVSGQVVLPDNSIITGTLKDNIRKKGEVTLLVDGKKTRFKAGDITSVKIGNSNYVTNNYTFYEIIWQGSLITLLRKANEPSGVQYNGTEPVAISGTEGKIDDYFVTKTNQSSFHLLTNKNIKDVLGKLCSSCAATTDIKSFDITTIKNAVEVCDKCN